MLSQTYLKPGCLQTASLRRYNAVHKLLDMHSGTREELITAIQRHWALQVGPLSRMPAPDAKEGLQWPLEYLRCAVIAVLCLPFCAANLLRDSNMWSYLCQSYRLGVSQLFLGGAAAC